MSNSLLIDPHQRAIFAKARLTRDVRFDGAFFIGVKTTGIYCRSVCPANQPLEKNVDYYLSAVAAAEAGFRPCLRCRPDSAPQSCAWLGTTTSFMRALSLIHQGALQHGSVEQLAERLGMSGRHLRGLFEQHLGTSPKKYALYQQCLFAKQLLHESDLPITDIAYASGFRSVRRFNEAIKKQLSLAPREIRKGKPSNTNGIQLSLHYRPPFAWQTLLKFLQKRVVDGLEWASEPSDDGPNLYGRTICHYDPLSQQTSRGYFTVTADPNSHRFNLRVHLDNYAQLNAITQRIRLLFDVDAPISQIDEQLSATFGSTINYLPGLRIPGIWTTFEAGVRAILGQQVSVVAAQNLVTTLVHELGEKTTIAAIPANYFFPEPAAVAHHDLSFFRMPQSRKDTLRRLANHFLTVQNPDNVDDWLRIKGIGPWTVNYVKMRSVKDPDIWLAGDAGINNALKTVAQTPDINAAQPWRSYLTFQFWNQLA